MKRFRLGYLLSVLAVALWAGPAGAVPGDLDTFGTSGFAFAGFSDSGRNYSRASGVVIQSDGKVVVTGHAQTNGSNFTQGAFTLARFNSNGTVDSTFGTSGKAITSFDEFTVAAASAIQSDGKVVVVGFSAPNTGGTTPRSLAMARYTTAGVLDSTFGTSGKVTVGIGVGGQISSMVIQPDGKIIVAGTVNRSGTGLDFLLFRFHVGGSLDTSFGQTGQFPNLSGSVAIDFGGQERANGVALQADGKIVVVGVTQVTTDSKFALARFSANGLVDSTFGTQGKVITNFANNDHGGSVGDTAIAVAVQSDGKIVVVGRSENNTANQVYDFALARYNANGTLDSNFANGGKATTAFDPGDPQHSYDSAFAVTIQPDGKIVAAGFTGVAFNEVFGIVRLTTNGALDTSFGNGGKVKTDRRGFVVHALALQRLLTEGKIVAAGEGAPTGGSTSMTVARFRAFPITFTQVGTFDLDPAETEADVHDRVHYAFTWTVPDPQDWPDLQFLQFRIRDGHDTLIWVLFDEASRTFSLVNEKNGKPGRSEVPGSHKKLESHDATLHLDETQVVASGPTSPTVTLHLSLSFKPRVAKGDFIVEVAASDDFGGDTGFVEAGALSFSHGRK